jgi:hypothetical protein
MELSASSNTSGGVVEVWLDSIDTGRKIAECTVDTTGSLTKYKIFNTAVDSVSGSHDVYLKFLGTGTGQLFRINWFRFLSEYDTPTSVDDRSESFIPQRFRLEQNYPNPFNPATVIQYQLPVSSYINLKVYDALGREVATLVDGYKDTGRYEAQFSGSHLASGLYIARLTVIDGHGKYTNAKSMKMQLVK